MINEQVNGGKLSLGHIGTDLMAADIFTKFSLTARKTSGIGCAD